MLYKMYKLLLILGSDGRLSHSVQQPGRQSLTTKTSPRLLGRVFRKQVKSNAGFKVNGEVFKFLVKKNLSTVYALIIFSMRLR